MSLSELPTELDDRILTFLDHDALNAVSKVSKYYRKTAEPYLYRHLEFDNEIDTSIRYLVHTLVARPNLAMHVKKFSMRRADGNGVQEEPYARLWKDLPKVQFALEKLLSPATPMMWQAEWIGDLIKCDGLQACLAFILCHTTNIESIDLDLSPPTTHTSDFFEILCRICENCARDGKLFFPKLTNLRSTAGFVQTLPFFPELQDLTIDINLGTFESCISAGNAASNLRVLTLDNASVTVASLCRLLKQQNLRNLQSLRMREAFCSFSGDLDLVLQSIRDHCPSLELLEWFAAWHGVLIGDLPMQGFHELQSLKTLFIDMEMILGGNKLSLSHPETIFPPNLELLHLSACPMDLFKITVGPYLQNQPDAQAINRYLKRLAPETSLRNVSISLIDTFEGDNEEPTPLQISSDMKWSMHSIACTLQTMGIEMSFQTLLIEEYGDDPLETMPLVDADFMWTE